MNTSDLQALAERTRFMRETGIALLACSFVLFLFLFVPLVPGAHTQAVSTAASEEKPSFTAPPLTARAAVVYDLTTAETLYALHADTQLPLASLTKLLTVYAALQKLSPDTPITISKTEARQESPHAFSAGDTLRLADLARITLTASLNDGAAAIANATAAREQHSTDEMLAGAAAGLGLSQTYAINGSGLDENAAISGGYGSAHDVALLAGALVRIAPDIALATTASTASATSATGKNFMVKNTNPTVVYAPRLLLSKTGFTDLAGGNIALVFDAGIGHPIAVVVLGSTQKDRFTDAEALVAATLAYFGGVSNL